MNNDLALIVFTLLAVLGRVNDWELLIIPTTVVIMLILSAKNRKVSKESLAMLTAKSYGDSKD
ncbi:hypothetical protein WDW86_22060 [Bdellovibrionota bacterium FG-2]